MKITQPSRRRAGISGTRLRLAVSLAAGATVAAVLVAWENLHNHAALAAAAAGPQPKGVHETVGSILATGGIFTALVVAAVVFAAVTVLARRRDARSATPQYPPAVPRRRSRVSVRW
jgi:cellobiose-specific phosphotransferase system component IIC